MFLLSATKKGFSSKEIQRQCRYEALRTSMGHGT